MTNNQKCISLCNPALTHNIGTDVPQALWGVVIDLEMLATCNPTDSMLVGVPSRIYNRSLKTSSDLSHWAGAPKWEPTVRALLPPCLSWVQGERDWHCLVSLRVVCMVLLQADFWKSGNFERIIILESDTSKLLRKNYWEKLHPNHIIKNLLSLRHWPMTSLEGKKNCTVH